MSPPAHALATLRCLRRYVPAAVPGIVILSGGQDHLAATAHLNAMHQVDGPKPWKLSFSFGRALQDEALHAWHGKRENLRAGQRAFYHRAKCVSAAVGAYNRAMEDELAEAWTAATLRGHRWDWRRRSTDGIFSAAKEQITKAR